MIQNVINSQDRQKKLPKLKANENPNVNSSVSSKVILKQESLQNFIEQMLEAVLLKDKSFESYKEQLRDFCDKEDVDFGKMEADIITFIEILNNLETTPSNLLMKLAVEKGHDCHISEETVNRLMSLTSKNTGQKSNLSIKDKLRKDVHLDAKKEKKKVRPSIIAVLMVGIIALILLILKYREKQAFQKETQTFNSCVTVGDFRRYVSMYPQGHYVSEACLFIDNFVKDSIAEEERLRKEREEQMRWACFNGKMDNGRELFEEGLFDQAKQCFFDARTCEYRHDAEIDLWVAKCDTAKLEAFVCGEHLLSLQWISWDYFGRVKIEKESGGRYRCVGEQESRYNTDYLRLDGYITIISEKHLKFDGTIKSKVYHLNGGREYCRKGSFDFKASGSRQYWREQKMNGADGCTDYVDIYFQKWE